MADMLSVGVSGLQAMQRALDVTSHNIANASTPGYSRQRVDFAAVEPQFMGGSYVGRGVTVASISRSYDALLSTQARGATSAFSRLDTFATNAEALSNLFADTSTGLATSLQKFSNAVQGVANDPTSTAARQVLLSEADGLRQRLNTYDTRLQQINAQVNAQVGSEATAITGLAKNIAQLNEQIVVAQNTTGAPPNDLLDARDQQIAALAAHVGVSVVNQADGSADVFIGSGQPLVLGPKAGTLVAQQDPFEPTRITLAYTSGSVTTDLGNALSGGSIGGLLDFRSQLLEPARNQLGQIAVGVASVVNAQHREGMDLSGALGTDLFSVGAVGVLPDARNTGTATPTVTRTDTGALTSKDYVLQYSGATWSMRQFDTGATVALTGTGTVADPFVGAGLSIVLAGTPSATDSFKLLPTANAIAGMGVLITDPAKVAAAAPLRASAATTNVGNATISGGEVLDVTNAQLRSTTTLQFIDATHYSVNGVGSFAFTAAGNISANGWRVTITGAPVAGDTFTVANNTGGVGDNRNALALSGVLTVGVLSGATESLNAASARMVGDIGVATSQARTSLEAQRIIVTDTTEATSRVSGVNLDEEASNLVRFQQAYQATAQIIKVTQSLFDTLLQATSR